jgi:hypothetical protein
MSEPANPSDFEDFAETTPAENQLKKQASPATRIRQTVLLVVLGVCLLGLAWEYLGARAGFVRCATYLGELEEEFNSASAVEVMGDENGQGIDERFTAENIRGVIGAKPYRVDEFGNGVAVIEYYRWRRANLYSSYDLAVLFRRQGATGSMIFADWYEDLETIPLDPSGVVAVDEENALPPQAPNVTGGVGTGGGDGEARRRRQRNRDEETEGENENSEDNASEETSQSEGEAEGDKGDNDESGDSKADEATSGDDGASSEAADESTGNDEGDESASDSSPS